MGRSRAGRKRRTPSSVVSDRRPSGFRWLRVVLTAAVLFAACAVAYIFFPVSEEPRQLGAEVPPGLRLWDSLPEQFAQYVAPTGEQSNIDRAAYAGPEACRECHPQNYDHWSDHPHRWMNALATEDRVVGDFSGKASIRFKGWTGTFYREAGEYRMRCERAGEQRVYQINQTIGSRFFQYYVGKGLVGSLPKDHDYYHKDHVLPFGYWIDRQAWVPIVHVRDELADDQRWTPLDSLGFEPAQAAHDPHATAPTVARGVTSGNAESLALQYATSCNYCHTTFPLGDMFVRLTETHSSHVPQPLFFLFKDYVAQQHPGLLDFIRPSTSQLQLDRTIAQRMRALEAPTHAVTLGVSCEACHLGAKAHAEGKLARPSFFAHSPLLYTTQDPHTIERGRSHANLNWVCSRCHNGGRPTFAGGMATWNSTEFTDAMKGACYSQLTCVHCHDPHQPTGKRWSRSPSQDDDSCLDCHTGFRDPAARRSHTHHAPGTAGDRCMNCHMPRINEGMQDVVRTHFIFSPTRADMIEANHPNACNLCHLDKPIDWTLGYLRSWYGKQYSAAKIADSYPGRQRAVGLGWLDHKNEAVRLVAAAALARSGSRWALPELIEMLDDDYLLNRQFTQSGLESMLDLRLDEQFGYWFYMMRQERAEPIERMRRQLLGR